MRDRYRGYEDPYRALASEVLILAATDWWRLCARDREHAEMMLEMYCPTFYKRGERPGRTVTKAIFESAEELGFSTPCQELREFYGSEWCQTLFDFLGMDHHGAMKALGVQLEGLHGVRCAD